MYPSGGQRLELKRRCLRVHLHDCFSLVQVNFVIVLTHCTLVCIAEKSQEVRTLFPLRKTGLEDAL